MRPYEKITKQPTKQHVVYCIINDRENYCERILYSSACSLESNSNNTILCLLNIIKYVRSILTIGEKVDYDDDN